MQLFPNTCNQPEEPLLFGSTSSSQQIHIIAAVDSTLYDNVGEEFEGAAVTVTVPLGCLKYSTQ